MQKKTVFKSLLGVIAATLMSACGNTDLLDNNLQGGANQPVEGSVSIQNVASCSMNPVADGFGIVCDGSLIGTLKHGSNGKDGSDGKDGSGCTLAELENNAGYQVTCSEDVGIITNGRDGLDGDGCTMSNVPTGVGMYLVCGEKAVLIKNGEDGADGKDGLDGKDGVNCAATAVSNGYALYCGDELVGVVRHGKDGKDGVDGVNGSSCYADPYEDGNASGFNLYCADSLIGIILNGKDGQDGTSSTDTLFISSQDTVVVKDSSYIFSKDTLIVRDSILLRDSTYIVVYDTIVKKDTLVFKDTLVVKDTLVISKKDTTVISKKDTVVVSKRDTVVVSKQDTVVISKKDTVVVRDTIVKKDTTVINNAVGCNIAKVVGSTVYIACGKDTTAVEANITINNTYNNGSLESTTFDPIIVYVSSSSENAMSSSVEAVINSSASFDYTVAIGKVTGTCSAIAKTVHRGDSSVWKMKTENGSSVDDIMNSIYTWDMPGSNVVSYTAKGSQGLIPNVRYDVIGTYTASVSINGDTPQECSGAITVEPSVVHSCRCKQDRGYESEDSTKWILSQCQSYAPITQYAWDGVMEISDDGLTALTPKSYTSLVKVNVTNSDGSETVTPCADMVEKDNNPRYTTPGTYRLLFGCPSNYVRFTIDGKGMWITEKTSSTISETNEFYYDVLFNVNKHDEALNKEIIFILESGTVIASCA